MHSLQPLRSLATNATAATAAASSTTTAAATSAAAATVSSAAEATAAAESTAVARFAQFRRALQQVRQCPKSTRAAAATTVLSLGQPSSTIAVSTTASARVILLWTCFSVM